MRVYTVHAPADDPAPERFAFVKDGFCWPALFIPILWILWHRMWLALVGYLVFVAAVYGIGELTNEAYAVIVSIAGAFVLGFEGNAIRRLSLERRGWREVGEAWGRSLSEAETRFFGDWTALPAQRRDALAASAATPRAAAVETSDEPILGLFPEPER